MDLSVSSGQGENTADNGYFQSEEWLKCLNEANEEELEELKKEALRTAHVSPKQARSMLAEMQYASLQRRATFSSDYASDSEVQPLPDEQGTNSSPPRQISRSRSLEPDTVYGSMMADNETEDGIFFNNGGPYNISGDQEAAYATAYAKLLVPGRFEEVEVSVAAAAGALYQSFYYQIFQIAVSLFACGFYIYETYSYYRTERWGVPRTMYLTDLSVTGIFILDYAVGFLAAQNKWRHVCRFVSFFDLLSIVPGVLIIFTQKPFLEFLMLLRLVRASYILRLHRFTDLAEKQARSRETKELRSSAGGEIFAMTANEQALDFTRHSLSLILSIVCLVFIATGVVFYLQVRSAEADFEDSGTREDDHLYFHEALYFVVITFATVGYGDIAPVRSESRMAVAFFLIMFLTFVPYFSVELVTSLRNYSHYLGRYWSTPGVRHVVLAGSVTLENAQAFLGELAELRRRDPRACTLKTVILAPEEPSLQLLALIRSAAHRATTVFLKGSALSTADLDRAAASEAAAIVLLTKRVYKKPKQEDAKLLYQAMSVASYLGPNRRGHVLVGVNRPQCIGQVRALGVRLAVSRDLVKLAGLSLSLLYPGAAALVCNLIKAPEVPRAALLWQPWYAEYYRGVSKQLYMINLPSAFLNISFSRSASKIYQYFELIMIGIQSHRSGKVLLNPGPGYKIEPGDVAFVIAFSQKDADKIEQYSDVLAARQSVSVQSGRTRTRSIVSPLLQGARRGAARSGASGEGLGLLAAAADPASPAGGGAAAAAAAAGAGAGGPGLRARLRSAATPREQRARVLEMCRLSRYHRAAAPATARGVLRQVGAAPAPAVAAAVAEGAPEEAEGEGAPAAAARGPQGGAGRSVRFLEGAAASGPGGGKGGAPAAAAAVSALPPQLSALLAADEEEAGAPELRGKLQAVRDCGLTGGARRGLAPAVAAAVGALAGADVARLGGAEAREWVRRLRRATEAGGGGIGGGGGGGGGIGGGGGGGGGIGGGGGGAMAAEDLLVEGSAFHLSSAAPLADHFVVVGAPISPTHLEYFLQPLAGRRGGGGGDDGRGGGGGAPVVVFLVRHAERPLLEGALRVVAEGGQVPLAGRVYYVVGSPASRRRLLTAGADRARAVVVMSSRGATAEPRPGKDEREPPDASTLLAYLKLRPLLRPDCNLVLELVQEASYRFLHACHALHRPVAAAAAAAPFALSPPAPAACRSLWGDGASPGPFRSFLSSFASVVPAARGGEAAAAATAEEEEPYPWSLVAAGAVYASSHLHALLAKAVFQPPIVLVLERLLGIDSGVTLGEREMPTSAAAAASRDTWAASDSTLASLEDAGRLQRMGSSNSAASSRPVAGDGGGGLERQRAAATRSSFLMQGHLSGGGGGGGGSPRGRRPPGPGGARGPGAAAGAGAAAGGGGFSELAAVDVPPALVHHSFGELYQELISPPLGLVAIGLYRAKRTKDAPEPYVYTAPTADTVLLENDKVYILTNPSTVERSNGGFAEQRRQPRTTS